MARDESARAVAKQVARGSATALETYERAASRYAAAAPLNAFVESIASVEDPSPGPLRGVPVAVKDLFADGERRPTAGSRLTAASGPTAVILERLRAAGAVLVGYTNLHEWAVGLTSLVSATGPIRNPWDAARIPGGSSGGSAAAVAAGIVPLAVGTDAGGSVRCPAACCGIVGFKPTWGAVPYDGYAGGISPVDHIGPLARNVADARLAFEVMSARRTESVDVSTMRVGIARGHFLQEADTQIASALEGVVSILEHIAASVVDVTVTGAEAAGPALPLIYLPHVAGLIGELGDLELLQPETKFLMDFAAVMADDDRKVADETRVALGRVWDAVFEEVDVVVTPTLPFGPTRTDEPLPDVSYLSFTAPMNLGGVPALAIPCGQSQTWWPVSITITGARGRDDVVLSVGEALERALDGAFADRIAPGVS